MSIFSKTSISTALDKARPFKFQSRHVTSSDFMQFCPVYHRECVPGSHIKVDVRAFSRLNAMVVPTFGDAKLNLRAFFVPMRTIFPAWDDFITDAKHTNASSVNPDSVTSVPLISNASFVAVLTNPSCAYEILDDTEADFEVCTDILEETPSLRKYRFTAFGRQVNKVLKSLGYKIEMSTLEIDSQIMFSALPLLSALRVYLDWYFPSQYVGDSQYSTLLSFCKRDSPSLLNLGSQQILQIFLAICFVSFSDDYFTSAFDDPTGNSQSTNSPFSLSDFTSTNYRFSASLYNVGNVVQTGHYNPSGSQSIPSTPVITNTTYTDGDDSSFTSTKNASAVRNISQYLLDSLKALTDYVKRHQLVGSRAFERFSARFGIEMNASKINRSYYLGSHSIDMAVKDVMSNADTTGAQLGDYAGQGFLVGKDGFFEYETKDDYGYFIICASIIPEIGYYQGVDRKCLHMTKLDFFTPEFDMLGTQPISAHELLVPFRASLLGTDAEIRSWYGSNQREKIFGFTPRYAEYKVGNDLLTGDFELGSQRAGDFSPSWHFFREVGLPLDDENLVHSKDFVKPSPLDVNASPTGNLDSYNQILQFDRVFYDTSPQHDHFSLIYYFNTEVIQPMKPLWDTYEFRDEFEHGKRVVDVNGVRMN